MGEAAGIGRRLGELLRKLLPRERVSLEDLERADDLRRLGDFTQAETLCAQVLFAYPHSASAHVVMGEILSDRGAREAAEASWREACRLHPEHPRANLRLAQLLLSRGEVAEAMTALRRALLGNPDASEAAGLYARLQKEQGEGKSDAPERAPRLLTALRACATVVKAALIGPGETAEAEWPGVGALTHALMEESSPLLERLGAGALRAVFLRGERAALEVVEVDGRYVISQVAPATSVGRIYTETQGLLAGLGCAQEVERVHVSAVPA